MTQAPELASAGTPAPVAKLCSVSPGDGHDVSLTSWPFVIGRSEVANLRVDSNRISREHASIQWEQGQFWVRDLGSTNGTFLNDAPVGQEQQPMHEGDVLRVADIALILTFSEALSANTDDSVVRLRAFQEMLLSGGPMVAFGEVRDLVASSPVGLIAAAYRPSGVGGWNTERKQTFTRLQSHSQWLMAVRAVTAVRGRPADECLLLEAPGAQFAEKWLGLVAAEASGRQLLVGIPEHDPERDRFAALIREHGLKVACYVGAEQDVPANCDQVWLKGERTNGIAEDDSRWAMLAELVQFAKDHGSQVIATEVKDEATMLVCAELGCAMAAGPCFGELRTPIELSGVSVDR